MVATAAAVKNIPQPTWKPKYPHQLLRALPPQTQWKPISFRTDESGILYLPARKDPCGDRVVSAATVAGFLFAGAPRGKKVAHYTANEVLAEGKLTSQFPGVAMARYYDRIGMRLVRALPGLQDNPKLWGVPNVASRNLKGAAAVYVAVDPFAHIDDIDADVAQRDGLAWGHLDTLARNVAWALKAGGEFRAADSRLAVAAGQQSQAIFIKAFVDALEKQGLAAAWGRDYVTGAGLTYFVYAEKPGRVRTTGDPTQAG